MKVAISFIAALALAAGASASTPSVAAMTLQKADVPGAKVSSHSTKETGYIAAYERDFELSSPYGTSRIVFLQNEAMLAASADKAASDLALIQKAFSSKGGKKLLVSSIAKETKVKPSAVVVGKLRPVAGWDQAFELPVSVKTKAGRVYENLSYLRIDRVVVLLAETGLHGISTADTAHFASLVAGHITTTLTPAMTSPPTISGTAQQGQTLTASPGTWTADDAAFTYQWQHCDSAGANCVDVAGATAQTYAVTAADVGTTLHVVVSASNRFGSATAPSAPSAVVT